MRREAQAEMPGERAHGDVAPCQRRWGGPRFSLKRPAEDDLRQILILASSVVFLETFFLSVLAPLLPTYKSDLGLSDAQVGLLSGAFAWGAVLGALPSGFLAQRFGPRRVVLAGLLLLSAASVAFGWVTQVGLLDLARLAQGLAVAVIWIGGFTWLVAATPLDRRGSAIGTAVLGGVVGPFVGPAVGALSAATSTRWVFTATLVLTLPLSVWVRRMKEPVPFQHQPLREVSSAILSAPVMKAFVFLGVPAVGFGFVSVLLPLKIDALGGTAGLIALAVIAAGAIETVLAPIAGRWSDRRGRREPYLFGLAAYCTGLAAMAATDSPSACAIAFLLVGVGAGFLIIPGFTILADAADHSGLAQSHGFALSSTAFSLGLAGGALAGGAIASVGGTTSAYLAMIAVLGLLALYVGWAPPLGSFELPRS